MENMLRDHRIARMPGKPCSDKGQGGNQVRSHFSFALYNTAVIIVSTLGTIVGVVKPNVCDILSSGSGIEQIPNRG